jgi:hypothetical protein
MIDRFANVFAKFSTSIKIGDAGQAAAFQHSPDQEKMLHST